MLTKTFLSSSLILSLLFLQACTFGVNLEVSNEISSEEPGSVSYYIELDNAPDSIDAVAFRLTGLDMRRNGEFLPTFVPIIISNYTLRNNLISNDAFLGLTTAPAGQIDDFELAIDEEAFITVAGTRREVELVAPSPINPALFDGQVIAEGVHTATFVLDFSSSSLALENGVWRFYPTFDLDWN